MGTKKRTRPAAAAAPPKQVSLSQFLEPYPGCCKPVPDATFANQNLVKLMARHIGRRCKGYLEPMDMEEWNAEVNRRASARSSAGGDD